MACPNCAHAIIRVRWPPNVDELLLLIAGIYKVLPIVATGSSPIVVGFVPEGHLRIAPHFSAGNRPRNILIPSPGGTAEPHRRSTVPPGLRQANLLRRFPRTEVRGYFQMSLRDTERAPNFRLPNPARQRDTVVAESWK